MWVLTVLSLIFNISLISAHFFSFRKTLPLLCAFAAPSGGYSPASGLFYLRSPDTLWQSNRYKVLPSIFPHSGSLHSDDVCGQCNGFSPWHKIKAANQSSLQTARCFKYWAKHITQYILCAFSVIQQIICMNIEFLPMFPVYNSYSILTIIHVFLVTFCVS